ncbi:MAG: sulfotransferase superfamily protein [Chitinophagaceae bacterium]|nr:sulfotransferase superfamily protein [Chitinophagaceae bacterium]
MLNQISRYLRLNILSRINRYPLSNRVKMQSPVFILSAGRSGSTLLRKILLRSGHVSIPPETHSLIPDLTFLYLKHGNTSWEKLIDVLIDDIKNKSYFNYWEMSVTTEDVFYLKHNVPHCLESVISFFYQKYSKAYHPNATVWGDKTPFLIYHTDVLNTLFPNARFIFITRDGRDVIESFTKNNIYQDIPYLCRRWIYSLKERDRLKKKKPKSVHLLQYEELVNDPVKEVEKICNFLSIPFHTSYLDNSWVHMGDDEQVHFSNTKLKVHVNNVGKWKKSLSLPEQEEIEKAIGLLLKKNGYEK